MYIFENKIRVRYSDVDKMGYVYYANYGKYYEVGRVEAMRNMGVSYKYMEENGVIMPALSMNIKYVKPAFYDDIINIKTIIDELPRNKMKFNYKLYDENENLINRGYTIHAFVSMKDNKIIQIPEWFLKPLKKYF
jgi:acyl-CoA thioester hydrolase